MEIVFVCVDLIKWIVIYMHGQRRLARSPTRVGKKPNYGWQEVEGWLAKEKKVGWQRSNTVVKRSDNGCDGKVSNNDWQGVRQLLARRPTMVARSPTRVGKTPNSLARSPTMVGKKYNNGYIARSPTMVGRKPTMVGTKSNNSLHEVQQWLIRSVASIYERSNSGW